MYEAATHDSHVLSGNAVIDSHGDVVGKIEELMIDLEEGRVAYAVLSFGRIEGMRDKLFAVPWEALTADQERHGFILGLDTKGLRNASVFDRDNAYPRLLWSPAPLGKGPIGMVGSRPWSPGGKRTNGKAAMRERTFAGPPPRVHR